MVETLCQVRDRQVSSACSPYPLCVVSFFKRDRTPSGSGKPVTVTLIGKPGCHLCDDARAVVLAVAQETGASVEELDLTAEDFDPALRDKYWEQIPVTLVNGAQHDFWRVDPVRLRKAVLAASAQP
jgi:hypothetical protein